MELVFTRPSDSVAEFAGEELIEADLYSLLNAFQSILKRLGSETPAARITRERMTLVERIDWLLERLNQDQKLGFRDLLLKSRTAYVVHPHLSRPARGNAPSPRAGLRKPPSGGRPDRSGSRTRLPRSSPKNRRGVPMRNNTPQAPDDAGRLRAVVEALVFAAEEPLTVADLRDLFPMSMPACSPKRSIP